MVDVMSGAGVMAETGAAVATSKESLSVRDLGLIYQTSAGPIEALRGVSLDVRDGEFISIIGPSGCGKSTLLHCLGGMLSPTSGQVTVDGAAITEPDPKLAAFVFQDYTLLPWKNVLDNAAIGLRFAGMSKADCRRKGAELLDLVGLSEFASSYPRELSGGMQQRVAIARAMCMDPGILLMDEPFGALDEQTRRHLGLEMGRLLTEANRTVVMVTHSLDEAILWADRIVVLSTRPGRIAREIRVDAPRPRPLSFVGTQQFAEIRAELFTLLESPATNPTERGDAPVPVSS
jgi:NitT/TauT family transport system ATP-binding protein